MINKNLGWALPTLFIFIYIYLYLLKISAENNKILAWPDQKRGIS